MKTAAKPRNLNMGAPAGLWSSLLAIDVLNVLQRVKTEVTPGRVAHQWLAMQHLHLLLSLMQLHALPRGHLHGT